MDKTSTYIHIYIFVLVYIHDCHIFGDERNLVHFPRFFSFEKRLHLWGREKKRNIVKKCWNETKYLNVDTTWFLLFLFPCNRALKCIQKQSRPWRWVNVTLFSLLVPSSYMWISQLLNLVAAGIVLNLTRDRVVPKLFNPFNLLTKRKKRNELT